MVYIILMEVFYEHEDPRKGFHPDWKSHIFNYGRNEVKIFPDFECLFLAR